MSLQEISRIDEETARQTKDSFSAITQRMHQSRAPEVELVDDFFDRYQTFMPPSFDMLSAREPSGDYATRFKEALEQGRVTQFLAESPLKDYYLMHVPMEHLAEDEMKQRRLYEPDAVEGVRRDLSEFAESVEDSKLPPPFKRAWKQLVRERYQFIDSIPWIGTPELMHHQMSEQPWEQLLDVPTTLEHGSAHLPYERLAREVLAQTPPQEGPQTFAAVFEQFKGLSEAEFEFLRMDDLTLERMPPSVSARFAQLMLWRLHLDTWQVEKSRGSVIATNPINRTQKFPHDRAFTPHDAWLIPPHEDIHALRGEVGAGQLGGILQIGYGDYVVGEEGLAVLAERFMGEAWGNERRRELAARYVTVADALKVEPTSSGFRARYSYEELYQNLVERYQIEPKAAQTIVWRVARGTSGRRAVVPLTIKGYKVPMAEAFPKDEAYFRGDIETALWVCRQIPVGVGMLASSTLYAQNFDATAFMRWGYARLYRQRFPDAPTIRGKGLFTTLEMIKAAREELRTLGEDAMLTLIDYLSVGKLPLAAFIDQDSILNYLDWTHVVNGTHQFRNLFVPREELPPSAKEFRF